MTTKNARATKMNELQNHKVEQTKKMNKLENHTEHQYRVNKFT